MVKGLVKEGSFVKWKTGVDSMASWQVASGQGGFLAWFSKSGFRGFHKRIQHGKIVIPQVFDIESLFLRSPGRWIPPGFPGEKATR